MRKLQRPKKTIFAIVFIIFLSSFFGSFTIDGFELNTKYCYATSEEEEDIEKELEEEIDKQLNNLDFGNLDTYLSNINEELSNIFAGGFTTKVENMINGDYVDGNSFFSSVLSLLWEGLLAFLPVIAMIIAVSILGGMVGNLKPVTGGKSIGNVVHFVTYGVIIVILGTTIVQLISVATTALNTLKSIMDAIFPVLLTLLTAVGGTVSVSLYQPAIAMIGNVFINLVTYFLMPIFIFSIIFSIVGNLSNNVKLDKFVSFLQGLFKWTIGLLFTLFLGFITIQGISASAVDGLSIRTAKYTIRSYVPIVGGYVSDGLFFLLPDTQCSKERPRLEYADQNECKREKARVKQRSGNQRRKCLPYIHSAISESVDATETV